MNCTIATKFKTHTPNPKPNMKSSMNKPRTHTSRVVGLSAGAFVSMGASAFCLNRSTVLRLGVVREHHGRGPRDRAGRRVVSQLLLSVIPPRTDFADDDGGEA